MKFDKPWQSLKTESIQQAPYPLVRERVLTHNGSEQVWVYVPGQHEWVCVLPITPQGKVIVLRQYRHIWGKFCFDLPGGGGEPGERPLVSVQRELLEEAGASSEEWIALPRHRFLGSLIASMGNPFLALGCKRTHPLQPDEGEFIEVLEMPLAEVYGLLEHGEDLDAAAVITLLWVKPILQQRRLLS